MELETIINRIRLILNEDREVPERFRKFYLQWIVKYIHFMEGRSDGTIANFLSEIRQTGQYNEWQVRQAELAVNYYETYYEQIANNDISSGELSVYTWEAAVRLLENRMIEHQFSERSRFAYKRWLERLSANFPEKTPVVITSEDIYAFMVCMEKERNASGATRNQAYNALKYFFLRVCRRPLTVFKQSGVSTAPRKTPVILTRQEIDLIFDRLPQPYRLICEMLYGCGLKLSECLRLRVRDIDLNPDRTLIKVDNENGGDRGTRLPANLYETLAAHLRAVREMFETDDRYGSVRAYVPYNVYRDDFNAGASWEWHWVFPSRQINCYGIRRAAVRMHMHPSTVQKHFKRILDDVPRINPKATIHCFRHSFAAHLLDLGVEESIVQEMLGHRSRSAMAIYRH